MSAPLAALVDRWRAQHFPPLPGRWVVSTGARAFAVAGLARKLGGPLLVVVPGERDAEELADEEELGVGERDAFRASAGALVMALLGQDGGREGMARG